MRTCWKERRVPRAGDADSMPMGPAAAEEAFTWLNRQLSWQSRLADLEGLAGVRPRRRARTS
jgi:hypothetical protein